jgi:cation diffusion facilitator family transporter
MHDAELDRWRHSHAFGQDLKRPGERKTFIVIALTGAMMIVEIAAGIVFGSMALLADGLHMASHATALGINAFAYVHARRHANDPRYSFGTGKVNTLGGFTGAVLLAGFAVVMGAESVFRFVHPVAIAFDQAIVVAVVGLLVNGISVLVLDAHGEGRGRAPGDERLGGDGNPASGGLDHHHEHEHEHEHEHDREHRHRHEDGDNHERQLGAGEPGRVHRADAAHVHVHRHAHAHGHSHDHNLASAYLHVLADALTSLLAIFALLAAKYFAAGWMDPAMGLVGAALVARWSIGLLGTTSDILLDKSPPAAVSERIRASIESRGADRVSDLHVWPVGPGIYSMLVSIVSDAPLSPEDYKRRLPEDLGIVHAAVEVHARTAVVRGSDPTGDSTVMHADSDV